MATKKGIKAEEKETAKKEAAEQKAEEKAVKQEAAVQKAEEKAE